MMPTTQIINPSVSVIVVSLHDSAVVTDEEEAARNRADVEVVAVVVDVVLYGSDIGGYVVLYGSELGGCRSDVAVVVDVVLYGSDIGGYVGRYGSDSISYGSDSISYGSDSVLYGSDSVSYGSARRRNRSAVVVVVDLTSYGSDIGGYVGEYGSDSISYGSDSISYG